MLGLIAFVCTACAGGGNGNGSEEPTDNQVRAIAGQYELQSMLRYYADDTEVFDVMTDDLSGFLEITTDGIMTHLVTLDGDTRMTEASVTSVTDGILLAQDAAGCTFEIAITQTGLALEMFISDIERQKCTDTDFGVDEFWRVTPWPHEARPR